MNQGFLYALIAALAWGTYLVPFKRSKSKNVSQFQGLMSIGILISGLIITQALGYKFNFNLYAVASGLIWAVANTISLSAVANLGISRSVPIISGMVIVGSFLWGSFVFNELLGSLPTGIAGILLIVFGIFVVSSSSNTQSKSYKRGLIQAFGSGLLFSSQLVPLKFGHVDPSVSYFPMAVGIFLFGISFCLLKKIKLRNEMIFSSLFSGAIWNIGNLFGIITVTLIGFSKGLPLTQLSVLVGVLWGLFYFKEITGKQILKVITGSLILLFGAMLLSIA